ncbi:cyclase family protein [Solirubrobacter sp. CPCC 204708]|uniref:Cyclase family protein n=1 Tax=Solirubrobacter deserti TaxID=2282478 RepID=A0ABT4RJS7_9ACTN|nr:cyclase family protein [Solirubrobacter deserti]MBE2320885.1 cyclase family protein [Solirubrobacter deserti]MDA0138520.1 cyclase family protein [Solirubrobacter deserti]
MCLPGTIEAVRESGATVSRRGLLAGTGAAALAALLPGDALAQAPKPKPGRNRGRVVDLTHEFTTDFPVYTPPQATRRTIAQLPGDGYYAQEWTFGEHTSTHMDAPGHFVQGGRFVTQLKPAELVVPIVVVDITAKARRDPDAQVTPDDLRKWERKHGRIPDRALVAMNSGWAAKLGTPAFTGRDPGNVFHFPGFSEDAVEALLEGRRASAIGVDTLSLDHGPAPVFVAHSKWLGADNYGIECLNNLDKLPAVGATAVVGVIPWQEGSGGPARVLATY